MEQLEQSNEGGSLNRGQCLCGKVQLSVAGDFGEVRYCHCSLCRRSTGSAFSANAKVSAKAWRIESGHALVMEYEHNPGFRRAFCSKCGSPLYATLETEPGYVRVRLGSFESVERVDITGHVWVSSKAVWYTLEDTLPLHPEGFSD